MSPDKKRIRVFKNEELDKQGDEEEEDANSSEKGFVLGQESWKLPEGKEMIQLLDQGAREFFLFQCANGLRVPNHTRARSHKQLKREKKKRRHTSPLAVNYMLGTKKKRPSHGAREGLETSR